MKRLFVVANKADFKTYCFGFKFRIMTPENARIGSVESPERLVHPRGLIGVSAANLTIVLLSNWDLTEFAREPDYDVKEMLALLEEQGVRIRYEDKFCVDRSPS